MQEGEQEYTKAFLENGYIQKLFEVQEILGEEVFEEHFEELTTMFTYTLNAMIFGSEELMMYD